MYCCIKILNETSEYFNTKIYFEVSYQTNYPVGGPPKIFCLTDIYHPNIQSDRKVSLNILNDEWTPANTLHKYMISIWNILLEPDFNNPCNN